MIFTLLPCSSVEACITNTQCSRCQAKELGNAVALIVYDCCQHIGKHPGSFTLQ